MATTLDPKLNRFVQLYVTGQYPLNKIAQLLEVHPNTVGKWYKREDVKLAIADLQGLTHDMVAVRLHGMTTKAADRLEQLMSSPIDGVALQAVKDVLDRSGHKPKNEIKIDKTITTVEQKLKSLIDETITFDAEYEVIE